MLLIEGTAITSLVQHFRGMRIRMIKIDGREFPNKQGAVEYYVKKMKRRHPDFPRKKAWAHINVIAEAQEKEKKNGENINISS